MNGKARPTQPDHQRNRRSQCSVSFIEVREVAKVRGQVSRGTGECLFHARQADKKVGIQRFHVIA
jgi:hypothetical protein